MEHKHLETLIVHGEHVLDSATGAIAPPIYPSSTFAFKSADQGAELFQSPLDGYIYTRMGNPTIDILRNKIALLEEQKHGLAFASGMAAIHAIFVALAGSGDSVVISDTVYGGTAALCNRTIPNMGINMRWVDCNNPDEVEKAIDKTTKLIFVETPANPTMKIIDMEAMADLARKHDIYLVVDNTFQTPYLQKPKRFGADIVMHSATKYLGGHGDLVAGLVTCDDDDVFTRLYHVVCDIGGIISPFNAWLLLRGIKTLHVRMDAHCRNAMKIAEFLEAHPAVDTVWYPGLKSHPQYQLGQKQMSGPGGVIAFEVKGGKEAGKIIMDSVHICTLAVSLGDIDTLIQHPASMTHSAYSKEDLEKTGISPGLIRLSVGLEHADDLIEDLEQAFEKAGG